METYHSDSEYLLMIVIEWGEIKLDNKLVLIDRGRGRKIQNSNDFGTYLSFQND